LERGTARGNGPALHRVALLVADSEPGSGTLCASKTMAGFRRRTPLGAFDEPPHPGGITRVAGYEIPGPLGLHGDGERPGHWSDPWRATDADHGIAPADGVRFSLGADSYCLRRADLRGSWPPDEESVPAKEAESVLERAVLQIGPGSLLSDLLNSARARVGQSAGRESLVLLRAKPRSPTTSVAPAAMPVAPPPKPAPAAAPKKRSWIEVRFLDGGGEAISAGRYRVELPNKSIQEGTISSAGTIHLEGIDPGSCRISLLDLEDAEWSLG
jgi:hypothetical protein